MSKDSSKDRDSSDDNSTVSGSSSNDGYQFTIVGGAVTAVFEIEDGATRAKQMKSNETWTVVGDQVVKTEVEHGYTEVYTFADANGDGIYLKISEVHTDSTTGLPISNGDFGDDSSSSWSGSGGSESHHGRGGDDVLEGNAGDDRLYGEDGDDHLHGGDDDDYLSGGSGINTVVGGAGDDLIDATGGTGKDLYDGSEGVDTVNYGAATKGLKVDLNSGSAKGSEFGKDKLISIENVVTGSGNDKVSGSTADNRIESGAGNDQISAGDGNDWLSGGLGFDKLTGGKGADTFDFNSLDELGLGKATDSIKDFRHAEGDRIDLSGIDANASVAGDQAFTFLSAAPVDGDQTGAVWFSKKALYISTDADAQAEFQINLSGVSALVVEDLIL
ncbi:MAG TPA: M10 family metallopeptidase C-terminal domain-containing protein [Burkholderiaceae bacterium]|nr:M10 family metallopeptidase C-terminal domain-containing protein [Burkholderiaceae bacterium]